MLNRCSGIHLTTTARYVKTVNTQPSGKTVGVYKHPNRLRWICGNTNSQLRMMKPAKARIGDLR